MCVSVCVRTCVCVCVRVAHVALARVNRVNVLLIITEYNNHASLALVYSGYGLHRAPLLVAGGGHGGRMAFTINIDHTQSTSLDRTNK